MAVTTAPYTNANLAAMIPAVWADIVNQANFPKSVLSNFVTDLSPYLENGGSVVHVPNIFTNVFTVSTQGTQGAEISTQAAAQVDVTLTVNTHVYVAWIIGDKDLYQLAAKYELNEKYATEAVNVLTQALEDALFALYTSLTTTGVGVGTVVQADLDLRQAIRTLDAANFDMSDTAFFFHPVVYWDQLGGIVKYYSQYASDLNYIKSGNFGPMDSSRGFKGEIYGQPVYTSSRVPTASTVYKNLFVHRAAFGFALQTAGQDQVRVQMEYQLRNLGMLAVVDMVYGVACLRVDAGVVLSSLVGGSVA
jgi:hypothetical protein